jgi:hypothetical protein
MRLVRPALPDPSIRAAPDSDDFPEDMGDICGRGSVEASAQVSRCCKSERQSKILRNRRIWKRTFPRFQAPVSCLLRWHGVPAGVYTGFG